MIIITTGMDTGTDTDTDTVMGIIIITMTTTITTTTTTTSNMKTTPNSTKRKRLNMNTLSKYQDLFTFLVVFNSIPTHILIPILILKRISQNKYGTPLYSSRTLLQKRIELHYLQKLSKVTRANDNDNIKVGLGLVPAPVPVVKDSLRILDSVPPQDHIRLQAQVQVQAQRGTCPKIQIVWYVPCPPSTTHTLISRPASPVILSCRPSR